MKKVLTLIVIVFLSAAAFSQTTADITGGRFFIKGYANGEEPNNAIVQTDGFTATSFLGGQYSPWFDICITDYLRCSFGQTFTVPKYSNVSLGGCVGDCNQFVGGTFIINGTTYQNVFYRGYFNFERVSFLIPKMTRRKGTVVFRKPFTLSGQFQVCQVRDFDAPCPADKILFNGMVKGRGTLTATMNINVVERTTSYPVPYLFQKGFEYQFER